MTAPSTLYFAGGGTGGHLFPGLAVASAWQRRYPRFLIRFVGGEKELERRIVEQHGFEFVSLPVLPPSQACSHPFRFLYQTLDGLRCARYLLQTAPPAVVIGLGGYAAFPLACAARWRSVPLVLLEQNVIPGRTNRWLARAAERICLAYPEAAQRVSTHACCVVTGNPVREEIAQLASRTSECEAPSQSSLLVLGGSQGAHAVNRLVLSAVERYAPLRAWKIVHQTGIQDLKLVQETYSRLGVCAEVAPFFEDLPARYASATACVARAGATTLAELCCAKLPTLLVPYPHAADDHQTANARWLVTRHAAEMFSQSNSLENDCARFVAAIAPLIQDADRRQSLSTALAPLAQPDAAQRVVEIIHQIVMPGG